MPAADWLSTICVAGLLIVVALVAVDRNRLKQRLNNAEGRVAGLSLDVDALQERVTQLTGYLGTSSSWDVGAQAPAALAEPVDRWTPKQQRDTEAARRSPTSQSPTSQSPTSPQRSAGVGETSDQQRSVR